MKKPVFTFIYFGLKESPIDFSKPISLDPRNLQKENKRLWNGKVRVNSFKCKVGSFNSSMSSLDFEIFTQIFFFGMRLVSSPASKKEKSIVTAKENKLKMEELEKLSIAGLRAHIASELAKLNESKGKLQEKSFEFRYAVEKIDLEMTKYQNKFLKCMISKLSGKHTFGAKGNSGIQFKIGDIEVFKPNERDKEKRIILKRVGNTDVGNHIILNQNFFKVPGKGKNIFWTVVDNFELFIAPMIINVNRELYESFSEYAFARENKAIERSIDELGSIRQV